MRGFPNCAEANTKANGVTPEFGRTASSLLHLLLRARYSIGYAHICSPVRIPSMLALCVHW